MVISLTSCLSSLFKGVTCTIEDGHEDIPRGQTQKRGELQGLLTEPPQAAQDSRGGRRAWTGATGAVTLPRTVPAGPQSARQQLQLPASSWKRFLAGNSLEFAQGTNLDYAAVGYVEFWLHRGSPPQGRDCAHQ
ncbi:hypothetical protein Y1Q_0004010 [Alligator mississippiensis]|uniref:Uncharacterized protein n=1 Tax=Alligator mississippiensis TaxID=8496 RepID=A0A151PHT8_ALLMI|nr:hypothetical protein Y1Q_0004010 [Alligator mississippiensis]